MGRATTKPDLLDMASKQFEKMWKLIDSMTEDEQTATFNFSENVGKEAHWARDKNLRDVLVHLYEWHQLLLNWAASNQNGEAKPFLPEPYNWKTYGQMNVEFWKKHQSTSYEDSKTMIRESHKKVIDMIEQFSNDELFAKNYLPWTGTSTLGSYCVSATASHYDWAIKKIKVHIKSF
ncbi:MAG TPA: ClbS/DfsB family four-helix bundle protein [Pseudobacteroides sp.]|uniref:ClbS/DfsB family four-helix bundle protein n=1 Tax=Pseudobacteroides sp. TaxID=1968840 RepID=UPI002F93E164